MLCCRMAAEQRSILLHGVDFTSAPRPKKGITIASGYLHQHSFTLDSLTTLHDFSSFADWLQRPGPWLGGFDFPFSFPRELVNQLGWPDTWSTLITHIRRLERAELREQFKAICDARPVGSKFIHRDCDLPAKSSSPMKWVNPPVAYMLHAGAPMLLDAGVHIPFMQPGDRSRIALEAYPGLVVRGITSASYKSDTPAKQTPARRAARRAIMRTLALGDYPQQIQLEAGHFKQRLIDDGSGDLLDAVLCALMAAWAWQRRDQDYGLPPHDPIEGWILGA